MTRVNCHNFELQTVIINTLQFDINILVSAFGRTIWINGHWNRDYISGFRKRENPEFFSLIYFS